MSDILRGLGNLLGKFGHGPEVSDTITRTFSVTGTPTIIAHDTFGSVRVVTGPDGAVKIDATRKARGLTADAVQRDLEEIAVTFAQDGNTIHVDARITRPSVTISVARQVWCDLVITVPVAADLDVKAEAANVAIAGTRGALNANVDAGNLELAGVTGSLVARVDAGNLEARDISFSGSSRLRVDAGQIILSAALAEGAALDLRVDAGRIKLTLPANTSAHLEASADVGSVGVSGWPIPVSRNVTAARAVGDLTSAPRGSITARIRIGDISIASS